MGYRKQACALLLLSAAVLLAQQPAAAPEPHNPFAGDQQAIKAGASLFHGECVYCHGRGGRLGPELSHVGSARPRAYLVESVRAPDKVLTLNHTVDSDTFRYDTATLETRDGRKFTGVPLNEDTFSVQVMDNDENIHSF